MAAMQSLELPDRSALLARFDTFFDAVLDWVVVENVGGRWAGRLQLLAWDRQSPSRRTAVLFEVSSLEAATLARPDQLAVQSFGVQCLWRDGRFNLFLNSLHDDPDDWPPEADIVGHLVGGAAGWWAVPVPQGPDGQPARAGHWSPPWPRPVTREAFGLRPTLEAASALEFEPDLSLLGRLRRLSIEFDRGETVAVRPATTLNLVLVAEPDPPPGVLAQQAIGVVWAEVEGAVAFSVVLRGLAGRVDFELRALRSVEKRPYGRLLRVEGRWRCARDVTVSGPSGPSVLSVTGHRVHWRRGRARLP